MSKCNELNDCLVSVIVPAYNVEKYIEQCIRSILKQSYKQLEVIVVDDGSTDSTGEILKQMQKDDDRLIAISQENCGVSCARNKGIEKASGDYLVFVDGDDYLASDCIFYLLQLVLETKTDFGLSLNCYSKVGEPQIENEKVIVLSSEDATALLLSPRMFVGCWNKIYSRQFIIDNNLLFEENLFYGEGLAFITSVAQRANAISVGERKVYYYRRNNKSSATSTFDIRKIKNGDHALEVIDKSLVERTPKIEATLLQHKCMFRVGALSRMCAYGLDNQYKDNYKNYLSFLRKNLKVLLLNRYITIYRKFLVLCCCVSPFFVGKLDILRRKINSHRSV